MHDLNLSACNQPSHFLGPHDGGCRLAGAGLAVESEAVRSRGKHQAGPPTAEQPKVDRRRASAAFPSQRCKRVIYLYMAGGPSHLETLDYKPKLAEMNGQPMPESITKGQPIAQLQGQQLKCFAPQHPFAKYGKSQQEICTIFPQHRQAGRRDLHHPLDAYRRDQSRPGPHVHEHRHDDLRPAVDGLVAAVWPGQRCATICPALS